MKMTRRLPALLLLVLLPSPFAGAAPADGAPASPGGTPTPSVVWAEDRLSVSASGSELGATLRSCAAAAGLELELDPALRGTVTVSFSGLSLEAGIDAVLAAAGKDRYLLALRAEPRPKRGKPQPTLALAALGEAGEPLSERARRLKLKGQSAGLKLSWQAYPSELLLWFGPGTEPQAAAGWAAGTLPVSVLERRMVRESLMLRCRVGSGTTVTSAVAEALALASCLPPGSPPLRWAAPNGVGSASLEPPPDGFHRPTPVREPNLSTAQLLERYPFLRDDHPYGGSPYRALFEEGVFRLHVAEVDRGRFPPAELTALAAEQGGVIIDAAPGDHGSADYLLWFPGAGEGKQYREKLRTFEKRLARTRASYNTAPGPLVAPAP